MKTIWNIAIQTPWWVYVLLIYLITIGILSSKTRTVSMVKLLILPVIFMYLSIHTLVVSFQINMFSVSTWIVSIVIGVIFGWLLVYKQQLKVDRKHLLIEVPGSWQTLILALLIFSSKYYFGYELDVDPNLAEQTVFEFSMLSISGTITGLFIGRVICYIYRLKTLTSVDLTLPNNK